MRRSPSTQTKASHAAVGLGPPGRILVVDDDWLICRVVSRVLSRVGHSVETAQDGATALELLHASGFDVVISDVLMPRMDGLDLLRAIRADGDQVPVLLMTGSPTTSGAITAVEYGASSYLAKPLQADVLEESVAEAIALRRAGDPSCGMLEPAKSCFRSCADCNDLGDSSEKFTRALEDAWIAFQPVVRLSEHGVFGYEALVRSCEPGLTMPLQLIDSAEKLDRVYELGRTLRARIAKASRDAPGRALLFVNLHPFDLCDEDLYDPLSPLARMADRVVLEVTERHSLDCVNDVRSCATRLHDMGYRIAIDDLGSGHSGLSSFDRLEPEVIKIDMAITRDVNSQPQQQIQVRSIARLAAELRAHIIAEGVETAAERDALAGLGCDLMQGYFFAKPGRGFPMVCW